MKVIVLSIKPEYVDNILKGVKKFEYRKRLAQEDTEEIYIYCTAPVMKVVASVKIINRLSDSPSALWERTKHAAGISRKKYREYFHGCKKAFAYELGEVNVFENKKTLFDLGIRVAPQSFVYIDI